MINENDEKIHNGGTYIVAHDKVSEQIERGETAIGDDDLMKIHNEKILSGDKLTNTEEQGGHTRSSSEVAVGKIHNGGKQSSSGSNLVKIQNSGNITDVEEVGLTSHQSSNRTLTEMGFVQNKMIK